MEKTSQHFITRWLPVAVWMIVIFFLSSRQSVTVSSEYLLNFIFFKTLHVLEYAILFILWARVTRFYSGAFVLTVLYAITDELHQMYVPSRQGHLRDVIIDGIGAGITWYYLSTQLPKAPKRLRDWARRLDLTNIA